MKKALITGITGQDGSYLAEFLLEKIYSIQNFCYEAPFKITDLTDFGFSSKPLLRASVLAAIREHIMISACTFSISTGSVLYFNVTL